MDIEPAANNAPSFIEMTQMRSYVKARAAVLNDKYFNFDVGMVWTYYAFLLQISSNFFMGTLCCGF